MSDDGMNVVSPSFRAFFDLFRFENPGQVERFLEYAEVQSSKFSPVSPSFVTFTDHGG